MSNYFQTDSSQTALTRKSHKSTNKHGDPIPLPSKILAAIPDPHDASAVLTAESAGTARRVHLDSKHADETFAGPAAPLTSLAVSPAGPASPGVGGPLLFAGCWDRAVWSWDVKSRKRSRRYGGGHGDFVKCVAVARLAGVDGGQVLISGGADAAVVVWCVAGGEKLHVLRGHARGVLGLAVEPAPEPEDELARGQGQGAPAPHNLTVWSACSSRSLRRWDVARGSAGAVPFASGADGAATDALDVHDTSVNRLCFSFLTSPSSGDVSPFDASRATLHTASSDGSAKTLSPLRAAHSQRSTAQYTTTQTLQHPDFVRAVIVVAPPCGYSDPLVVTACRDENVRVWDAGDGALLGELEGHYEEVTDLVGLRNVGGQDVLVSVSIDGTVRRWGWRREVIESGGKGGEREGDGGDAEGAGGGAAGEAEASTGKGGGKGEVELTEEEENELAELMDEG